ADSVLFAAAFCIPLVRLLIAADKKSFQLCLVIWPMLIGGMIANGRRLVWVEISIVAVIVLLMTPWTPVKRALVRVMVLMLPFTPVYFAVGWNSNSAIFKPVKTFRSITDSNTDRSSATRDIENYNLIHTLKMHSFVPMGFGHEYHEMVMADDISQAFPQYRFIPHNSVLGLWAFAGVLGFTGIWMMLGVAVYFAARSYRMTRNVDYQTAALCCIGTIFIYLMQAYGDMGLVNWNGVFLVTPALVVAGKLAVATGAFPSTRPFPVTAAAAVPALTTVTAITAVTAVTPEPVPNLGPPAAMTIISESPGPPLGPEPRTLP
ncbi:MAG TPA: O-antigen ligase family protein, partial [Myxococcaceae bacterium]